MESKTNYCTLCMWFFICFEQFADICQGFFFYKIVNRTVVGGSKIPILIKTLPSKLELILRRKEIGVPGENPQRQVEIDWNSAHIQLCSSGGTGVIDVHYASLTSQSSVWLISLLAPVVIGQSYDNLLCYWFFHNHLKAVLEALCW